MKLPWPHDRCIVCRSRAVLTEEHLIPRALGGRLTADFLCKSCNGDLGHRIEALAKKDPDIVLAISSFAEKHPEQAQRLADGMDLIVRSEGPAGKARRRGTKLRVKSQQLPDGSLIQPTSDARKSLKRMLQKQGVPPLPLEAALCRFDSVPPNERVEIVPGLEIVKWSLTQVEPDLSGHPLTPLLPLKIAYEFLAGHLGATIYDSVPPLEAIRESLRTGVLHDSIRVEYLLAKREQPLHGLLFEGNAPHARVQIRLFGSLVYRVHFKNLAVDGRRCAYTCLLESGEEHITETS